MLVYLGYVCSRNILSIFGVDAEQQYRSFDKIYLKNIQIMGNSNKRVQDYEVVSSYDPNQWSNKQKRAGYEIWENAHKNIRADVYPIPLDLRPSDLDHYQMRHNSTDEIVRILHLRLHNNQSLCSRSADAYVFVQRIPHRLSDLGDLTQLEALSVLRSAYSGFNTISTFYGPVQPYEDLICFNEEGKPKVWVNSNLATPHIERQAHEAVLRNPQGVHQAYVNKILNLVENRTAGRALPEGLKNKFRRNCPKSYFQACNTVEQFALESNLRIPRTIRPRQETPTSTALPPTFAPAFNAQKPTSLPLPSPAGHGYQPTLLPRPRLAPGSQVLQLPPPVQSQPGTLTRQYSQTILPSTQVHPSYNTMSSVVISRVTGVNQGYRQGFAPVRFGQARLFETRGLVDRGLPIGLQTSRAVHLPNENREVVSGNKVVQQRQQSPRKEVVQSQIVSNKSEHEIPYEMHRRQSQSSQAPSLPRSPQKQSYIDKLTTHTPENQRHLHFGNIGSVPGQPSRPAQQVMMIGQQTYLPNRVQQFVGQVPQPKIYFHHPVPQNMHPPVIFEQQRVHPQPVYINQPQNIVRNINHDQPQPVQTPQSTIIQNKELVIGVSQPNHEPVRQPLSPSLPQSPSKEPAADSEPITQTQINQNITQQEQQLSHLEHHEKNLNDMMEDRASNQSCEQQEGNQQAELQDKEYLIHREYERQEEELRQGQQKIQQAPKQQRRQLRQAQSVQDSAQDQQERQERVNQSTQKVQYVDVNPPSQVQPMSNIEEQSETNQFTAKKQTDSNQIFNNNMSGLLRAQHFQSQQLQFSQQFHQPELTEPLIVSPAPERIPDNARYQDIEAYIRNKYKSYIGSTPVAVQEPTIDVNFMASYVETKYDEYTGKGQFSFRPTRQDSIDTGAKKKEVTYGQETEHKYGDEESQGAGPASRKGFGSELEVDDVLDVRFLEKSLDKKYSSLKSNQQIKSIDNANKQEQDSEFDVKKLQQNLIRFQQSRVGNGQPQRNSVTSQARFQTSQVSKIHSIDYRISGQRRSSFKQDIQPTSQVLNYKVSTENHAPKPQKRTSARLSKQISAIDQKFNKYVNNPRPKPVLKPKEHNYQDNYDGGSRMATGHFGAYEEEGKKSKDRGFATSEVKSHKGGLTYEDLRKFMWN